MSSQEQDFNNQNNKKYLPSNTFNVIVSSEDDDSSLEMVPLDSILAKEENVLNKLASKDNRQSDLLREDSSVKKALAEISFIEANETLEIGDFQGAINKCKEAIRYFPDNPDYYLKLIEIYNKDIKYKNDLDILEKSLDNKLLAYEKVKSKLNEIRSTPKTKLTDKNQINHIEKDLSINKNLDKNQTSLLKESKESATRNLTRYLRTNKPEVEENIEDKTQSKAPRMVKLRNNVYVLTEGVKKQNPYVKAISMLILILLPLGIFWGLNRSYKETIIETSPISPDAQSKLTQNQLYFCWNSNSDKVDYLFQIEQDGKPVLERYTKEKFYLVSQEDSVLLRKNIYSTWRAIPISPKREPLKYKTYESQFMITDKE